MTLKQKLIQLDRVVIVNCVDGIFGFEKRHVNVNGNAARVLRRRGCENQSHTEQRRYMTAKR